MSMVIPVHPGHRFFQALFFERTASEIMAAAKVQAGRVKSAIAKRTERIRGLMKDEGTVADYSLDDILRVARSPQFEYAPHYESLSPATALIVAEATQLALEMQIAERFDFVAQHLVGDSAEERNKPVKMILEDAMLIFDTYEYREQSQPETAPHIGPQVGEAIAMEPMVPRRRGGLQQDLYTQGGGYAVPNPLRMVDLLKR